MADTLYFVIPCYKEEEVLPSTGPVFVRKLKALINCGLANENSRVLYLELGVGGNTPVIIKYPFWQMTLINNKATYACLNFSEADCPAEIAAQSVCLNADIGEILDML